VELKHTANIIRKLSCNIQHAIQYYVRWAVSNILQILSMLQVKYLAEEQLASCPYKSTILSCNMSMKKSLPLLFLSKIKKFAVFY
jgi:hypothetical protein